MSSGACRALVALLLTLTATVGLALPAGAKEEALTERSTVTYKVYPDEGRIDVRAVFVLKTKGGSAFQSQEWGPIIVERRTRPPRPNATGGFEVASESDLPGLWRGIEVLTPTIEGGAESERFILSYSIDARVDGTRSAETPARVDSSYMYFCVPGQDTDSGQVTIEIDGDRSAWDLTQLGTQLQDDPKGLRSDFSAAPAQIFTCIEGVNEGQLRTRERIGPAGREIILQAWRGSPGWLDAAEDQVIAALERIHAFLGIDIPGSGPVIVRQAPNRELGGYASAHDTPGIVQLDERAGVEDAEHQLAHAWFGTDNVSDLWLREGLAMWTATAQDGAACDPVDPDGAGLDLDAWEVLRPTSGADWEERLRAQDEAACGIVSAIAGRMSDEQWREVLGSMLRAETKYIGSDGPEIAANPNVDWREFLDAVDERGLVPAGETDLDFAQDLLAAYGVDDDERQMLLEERSEARARYHQFLADAAPLGAPLVIRKALDDWEFRDAMAAIDQAYDILANIREADAALPSAGLIPLIERPFEEARDIEAIQDVLDEARALAEDAAELVTPLADLNAISPSGWGYPLAISAAISERRFDDVKSAIEPAVRVVRAITAADEALPAAGILERFQVRYESRATAAALDDLVSDADAIRRAAVATGRDLAALETAVEEAGGWRIPAVVTAPIARGDLAAAAAIISDALATVEAAVEADEALPEAGVRAEIRPRFEAVTSAAEMSALRAEAETRRDEAVAVGGALARLQELVPDWTIPEVVTAPIEARDFATAAVVAKAAQSWVENADEADEAWPGFGAKDRIQADFEGATTLEELQAGADKADKWAQAASSVERARAANQAERDLLTEFGLWGVDIDTPLRQAEQAALDGDVDGAINYSGVVVALVGKGASDGALRLTGIVFFAIAVLGVLGLWVMLRRQRGPSWARQTKPHWLEEERRLPFRRSRPQEPQGRQGPQGRAEIDARAQGAASRPPQGPPRQQRSR